MFTSNKRLIIPNQISILTAIILLFTIVFVSCEGNGSHSKAKSDQLNQIKNWYLNQEIDKITTEYTVEKAQKISDLPTRFLIAKAFYFSIKDTQDNSFNRERITETEILFTSIVKENPQYIEAFLYLAKLEHYFTGNKKKALKYIQQGLELENDNLKLLTLLFKIYQYEKPKIARQVARSITLYANEIEVAKEFLNQSSK